MVDAGSVPAEAPVDPDDWAVRRRRALWRAAGARAAGIRAWGSGQGRVPAAVLLDMGGVVIPTLFESVAMTGFPGGALPGRSRVRGRGTGRGGRAGLLGPAGRAAARPGRGSAVAGVLAGAGRGPGGDGHAGGKGPAGGVHQRHGPLVRAGWPGRFPELAGFDQVVEAARLGVLKPDPEAFRLAAAEIGEAPERCLFVDDLAVNLDGAAAVGMQTLLFEVRDPAGSIAALLARLGLDPDPPPASGRVFSVR